MSNHKDHSNKTVSQFPGRKVQDDQPAPIIGEALGGDQGAFERAKCGECFHWKKEPRAGLGQGWCMLFPPSPFAMHDNKGNPIGQMKMRPMMKAGDEGCDQHDDGTEEGDDDGDGSPVSLVKAG